MFIKDSFIDLLNELSGAQESIEKVSVWIQQYRDQAPVIAQAWKNFYLEASQEKKLTLLFLVNDVLQHSKRKGTQFVDAFGHILPKCMSECKNADSKSQIERMLDIWESREVFHKHIISAMKYNLDEIGMDESHVKLTDLMDSLDLLRAHEKKSSDVLTKLSHRLDTTDFANAFNVTSRKEGDKYAADFDETAHFLEQYCSCLLKQTEARSSMIQKINTTMFQMEKTEETIKTQDKEYKNQQGTLVRTRKAVTSRLMLIDEGKVNFGDESPDREEIENLTSEEEDVDIEGIETVESSKKNERSDNRSLDLGGDDFNGSFADDGIRPEDAIDEQLPYAKPREPKKPKKTAKKLPSYDPRQILSYGFRLDAPPDGEQAVGFMLLPDGTLAAIPIAPHMFLAKPKPVSPKAEKKLEGQIEGPKTPEGTPTGVGEDDEISKENIEPLSPDGEHDKAGPKTPDEEDSELEEGEVSESENEDAGKDPGDKEYDIEADNYGPSAERYDDEVDGVPFDILEDGYRTDEDKESGSSVGSAPSMPSPEVSDEEDPREVAMRNVTSWKNDYNELDGEEFEEPEQNKPRPPSSSEEGELSDENNAPVKAGMTGLASFLDRLSDGEEKKQVPEERSEYEQFYPPGYLEASNNEIKPGRNSPPVRPSKPAYLMGSNVSPDRSLESSRKIFHREDSFPPQSYPNNSGRNERSPEPRMRQNSFGYGNEPPIRPSAPPYNGSVPRMRYEQRLPSPGTGYERNFPDEYVRHGPRDERYPHSPTRHRHSPPPLRNRSPPGRSPPRNRSPPRHWSPPRHRSPSRHRSPLRHMSPPRHMHMPTPPMMHQQHQIRPQPSGSRDYQSHPRPYPPVPVQRHAYPPPRQPRPLSYYAARPLYINQNSDDRMEDDYNAPMNHFLGVSPRAIRLEGVGSGGIIEATHQLFNVIRLIAQCAVSVCVFATIIRKVKVKLKLMDILPKKSKDLFDIIRQASTAKEEISVFVMTGNSYGPPLPQRPAAPTHSVYRQQSQPSNSRHQERYTEHQEQTYYAEDAQYVSRQGSYNAAEYIPDYSGSSNRYQERPYYHDGRGTSNPSQQPYHSNNDQSNEYSNHPYQGAQSSSVQFTAQNSEVQQYADNSQSDQHYGIQRYNSAEKFGPPLPSSNPQIYYKDESSEEEYFEPAVQRYSSRPAATSVRPDPAYPAATSARPDPAYPRPGPPQEIKGRPPFDDELKFPVDVPQLRGRRPPFEDQVKPSIKQDKERQRSLPSDDKGRLKVKEKKERRRHIPSDSGSSSDAMSESSDDLTGAVKGIENVPFADLPAPRVNYARDSPEKPFADIPAPRIPATLNKGINSKNFTPFNESLLDEKQKFKPIKESGEKPKFASFPSKSIYAMLKEEDSVTSIDKILDKYDMDSILNTKSDSDEDQADNGPSILQSIFGGESRMAPNYEQMEKDEEMERQRKEKEREEFAKAEAAKEKAEKARVKAREKAKEKAKAEKEAKRKKWKNKWNEEEVPETGNIKSSKGPSANPVPQPTVPLPAKSEVTKTAPSPSVTPQALDPDMEAKRAEVLAKIALFKEQNEKEKQELAKWKQEKKGDLVIKDGIDPTTLTNSGKRKFMFNIDEAKAIQAAKSNQVSTAQSSMAQSSTVSTVTATAPVLVSSAQSDDSIRAQPDTTLSVLPTFYQSAVQGLPPSLPTMPGMGPPPIMPPMPTMPIPQGMNPGFGFNPGMGMPNMPMNPPGLAAGNQNMGNANMGNQNMFNPNMMGNPNMIGNQNMGNQNWFGPPQGGNFNSFNNFNNGFNRPARPSPSVISAPPTVQSGAVRNSAPAAVRPGAPRPSAPRPGAPRPIGQRPPFFPRNSLPIGRPSLPTSTVPRHLAPKVHNLQLASSQASSIPKQITVGSHSALRPAVPKVQTPIDEEKMKKALEVKQKLEEGMKKFQAMQQQGQVVKRQRFDVKPDEVELKNTLNKDEPPSAPSQKGKPLSAEATPGVDLDDIDNLVDLNTADLDLELDFE